MKPTTVRWRVVGLIMAVGAVGYVLRTILSVAAPSIKTELGLTEPQLGLVMSAFVATYAIGQIPGGLVSERFGARLVMTTLLVGWGAATLAIGLVPKALSATVVFALLITLRGAMGVLQAPLFPVATDAVRAWLPARQWGLGNAVQNFAYTLASAAAAPLLVWIISTYGWRTAFIAGAPIAFVFAALWWWTVRDDPSRHPGVNAAEVDVILEGRAARSEETGASWITVATNRDIVLTTISYFFMNYVFYLFFNWFYYYLTEVRHIAPETAGYFNGAQWVIGAIGAMLGGLLCDGLSARFGERLGCRMTAWIGVAFSAPCIVLGVLAQSPWAIVILLSISFGATQLVDAAYWVAVMRVAGPRAPLAAGILNTGGNLAGTTAAILVPIIAGWWGWAAGVGSGVVFSLIAATLWLGIRADRRI